MLTLQSVPHGMWQLHCLHCNQPRKRRLDSKCASEISFRIEDYYQKPCNHSKVFMDPGPNDVQKTTDKEIKDFIENLKGLVDF